LPLQFVAGENAQSLNLTGEEIFEISAVSDLVRKFAPGKQVKVRATSPGRTKEFHALVRIDTPQEAQYYANGGILQFVLRQLIASKPAAVHV
jgi:aconitate hydratase